MNQTKSLHFVTVGTSERMVRNLWDRIAQKGGYSISHIVHPSYDRRLWADGTPTENIHFFREDLRMQMPLPNREFLASLEVDQVPTIHNMIMSDRFVSKLDYGEALGYATFLAQRLIALYEHTRPSVIIGGFDAIHGSLALAVAKRMSIPWFAPIFGALPSDQVAFCADLSPASMITFDCRRQGELRQYAEAFLRDFEERRVQASAYIPPNLISPSYMFKQIPVQSKALLMALNRRRLRKYLKYTDYPNTYSPVALVREALRRRKNLLMLRRVRLVVKPVQRPYAFFGLHMQPESSIDVFSHFFSNQLRVIELMSRSLPPTHTLLVKLHKSDASNYSVRRLASLSKFPGVELISPYADTVKFIRNAELVFSIQGTIGLEAALLGKPVIMFGDSPIAAFPNVSTIGKTIALPGLVREKLLETKPSRSAIVDALTSYLAPFYPASGNDWGLIPRDSQIEGYVDLFELIKRHVEDQRARVCG